jgi:hypothetical protein
MFYLCLDLFWLALPRWIQAALALLFVPWALAIDIIAFGLTKATSCTIDSAELAAACLVCSASLFWMAYSFVSGGFFVVVVVVVVDITSALSADFLASNVWSSFEIHLGPSVTRSFTNTLLGLGLAAVNALICVGTLAFAVCRLCSTFPIVTCCCAIHVYLFK